MKEIWKDILGLEGLFQISNLGRVKSLARDIVIHKKEKILKTIKPKSNSSCQYEHIPLGYNKKQKDILIHRELAKAFIPIPDELKDIPIEDLYVNHKDENKFNNSLDNLEWCTASYNVNYGTAKNRQILTQQLTHPCNKPVQQYDKNGNLIAEYISMRDASRKTGIPHPNICDCIKGRKKTAGGFIWKNV